MRKNNQTRTSKDQKQNQNTCNMIAETILEQLGGKEFILMTGSKNLVKHEVPDEAPWLRMDLIPNDADVNRLKIIYNIGSGSYSMHFYKFTFKDSNCTISNEKKFEDVYFDQLEEIFTSTTGLHTRIPRIKLCSNKGTSSFKKNPKPEGKKLPSTPLRLRQNKKKNQ